MLQKFENLSRTIRNLHSVTDLIASMGENTDSIFDIEDNFRNSDQMAVCVERVKAIPEARAMMEERYLGPKIDLDALLTCPKGSLGHTYAVIMKTLGYDPNFFRHREIESDGDWLTLRVRKTHDLMHIVSGFGPTGGELGVLAIQAVQTGYPMSMMVQIGSLGLVLKTQPQKLEQMSQQVARGMAMGLEAKTLVAQRWEAAWDKPVAQWRQELNIHNPVIDEPYSLKNRLPELDLDW